MIRIALKLDYGSTPFMAEENRPNIFLIITDQQRYDTIRAHGYDHVETPNLDRLVREGISFKQCHITAPSCAPSRASLFTGTYPHTNGVLKNKDPWPETWVEDLARAGYHCVNIGKMHTEPLDGKFGFHERYTVENKDRFLEDRYFTDEWDKALKAHGLVKQGRPLYRTYADYRERMGAFAWELPEKLHSDVFVGDSATWWIRNKPKPEGPLFMEIGFPGPHPPFDPTQRFLDRYAERKLPLPVVKREDIAGQPVGFRDLREHNMEVDHDSVVHLDDPEEAQLQRLWAHYLANITMIDEKIGEFMTALKEQGYLEDSVIIFTSDHGEALGEHGHIQKWTMYDCVTRVPCIVHAPGQFKGGRTIEGLCQLMDLGPTILELAGLEPPDWMEARSLKAALDGESFEGRPYVVAEHGRDMFLNTIDFVSMVRTSEWKLVHFLDAPDGQLFDLLNDPAEETNRWDDSACREIKAELLDILREFRIRSGYHTRRYSRKTAHCPER